MLMSLIAGLSYVMTEAVGITKNDSIAVVYRTPIYFRLVV